MSAFRKKIHREGLAAAGKRTFALLLSVLMFLSICPIFDTEAEAAEAGDRYILSVLFGTDVSDGVQYYGVNYYDERGIIHTQFLFPNYGEINSRVLANQISDGSIWEGNLGANERAEAVLKSPSTRRNCAVDHLGYATVWIASDNKTQILRTMELAFISAFPVASIHSIDIYGDIATEGHNEISIQRMDLYKVDTLYNYDMVGCLSDEYFTEFTGSRILRIIPDAPITWGESGGLTRFKADGKDSQVDATVVPCDRTDTTELVFAIDIADIYAGGLPSLNTPYNCTKTSGQSVFSEMMSLQITYLDTDDCVRRTEIPVVMSALLYDFYHDPLAADSYPRLAGIAQQGDKVVFSAKLPDFKELYLSDPSNKGYPVLTVGYDKAKEAAGLWEIGTTETATACKAETGKISITTFAVYNADSVFVDVSSAGNALTSSVEGDPLYYYKSSTNEGTQFASGASTAINVSKCEPGSSPLKNRDDYQFLFELYTDNADLADTADHLQAEVYYHAVDGTEKSTGVIDLKDAAELYYGYWVGKDGDVAYKAAVSRGGTLSFTVRLTDVDYFTGISIGLKTGATDDWQIEDMNIYEIFSMGHRKFEWKTVNAADGTALSDRLITRDMDKTDIFPNPLSEPVLIQPGKDPKLITFTSDGTSITNDTFDWSSMRYSMSYEDALQDFGFAKNRYTYNIKVQVAGDKVNLDALNENCGSQNHFFFQINFEDGSSSYVLANQQLSADGFITGQEADFVIKTNMEYGDVASVRVIPETQGENLDPYDKLKIDKITVERNSDSGFNVTWVTEPKAWVGVSYNDSGEKTSILGQPGKSADELAQNFRITSKGYSMKILFAISTDYFSEKFGGQLMAKIVYQDTSGKSIPVNLDLIKYMTEYAQKTVTNVTYTASDNSTFSAPDIDYNFLLRDNHTDRFEVSLSDVASIKSITLSAKGSNVGGGSWHIKDITAYTIESGGNLIINDDGEYQKTNKLSRVTSLTEPNAEIQFFASGTENSVLLNFEENSIEADLVGEYVSTITAVPKSKDDTLNIYAYMKSSRNLVENYQMKASIKYKVSTATTTSESGTEQTVNDASFAASALLTGCNEKNMFYAMGIKTSGITNLSSVYLKTFSDNAEVALVDYMIVEQVRSGVVIGTYYIDFQKGDAEYGIEKSPSTKYSATYDQQDLTFMVSEDSDLKIIMETDSDIAVALNYTSTNDPTGRVFSSPYHFLSDEELTSLRSGDVVHMSFNQKYLKDIASVSFAALGGAVHSVKVTNAYAENTEVNYATGEREVLGSYSFGSSMSDTLGLAPVAMKVTDSSSKTSGFTDESVHTSVAAVKMVVSTQGAGDISESGTTKPIRMKVVYDGTSLSHTQTFEDMKTYVTSGSFTTGSTATLEFLLNDYEAIRYIEFEPYDAELASKKVSWSIENLKVNITADGEETPLIRNVKKTATTGDTVKVGLAEIQLSAIVYTSTPGKDGKNRRLLDYKTKTDPLAIKAEQRVEIIPTLEDSIEDLTVECVSVTENGATAPADDLITVETFDGVISSVLFTPGTEAGIYRVTLTSLENKEVNLPIVIEIQKPEETEKEASEEDSEKDPDEKSEEKSEEKSDEKSEENAEENPGENPEQNPEQTPENTDPENTDPETTE